MRQLRWGLKAEFPYTKVFILGILLTVLGSACVVVSVVGIVQLAWGYYVSTGMWGGVTVTISGLAAIYAARAQSSISARLYFFLSVVTCLISFAMIVLSAGGLTYKSNFYQPMRFDSSRHQVTLFLHGSVLGVAVLSLACNVLSVIVCCKFITREKNRGEETFKLRRHRYRFSDPNAVYRTGSLRGGSGPVRSSTSSRTPLFGSDRSHKHSRQASETDSTNLKIPGERNSHRRDSDRSKGSSRSRHSHHRQSSSISQQSRQSAPMEAEVTTVLLRDTEHNSVGNHREQTSSHSTIDNARDSQADTLTDNMSVQLVFDPDEEPPPPYEEARPLTFVSSDGNESDTETVDGSSNVVVPSCLPLNIPVTHIRACQTQSLQRQPPPMEPSPSQVCEHPQQSRGQHSSEVSGALIRIISEPNSSEVNSSERDNRVNLMRMTLADQWPNAAASATHPSALQDEDSSEVHPSEDGSASPEICALTGERMTPVAAVQPDTVTANNTAALTSCISQRNPSPDSSDTSIPGELITISHNPALSHPHSGTAHAVSSETSSALPAGIHSPSSAFRPVGKRVIPLAQASPSHSVPLHNIFSPISSPGSAHHTVYSPVASPSSAARFASPTSPHHANNMASSSESLSRGGCVQSLSWKKIPLPSSHNHSNRTSSVPFKEVISKTIPGPAQSQPKDRDTLPHSLPKRSSKDKERGNSNTKNSDNRVMKTQFAADCAERDALHKQNSKLSSPIRRPPQRAQPASEERFGSKVNEESFSAEQGNRSAFVSRPGVPGSRPINASNAPAPVGKQVPVPIVGSQAAIGKQVPIPIVGPQAPVGKKVPVPIVCSQDTAGKQVPGPQTAVGKQVPVPIVVGVNSRSDVNNSHSRKVGTQPVAGIHRANVGSNSSATVNYFTPVGSQPVCSQPVNHSNNKQPTALASPRKVARDQVAGMDPNCRSTGCQATDDGGIASSMDRTHRWVMGTLPSGTRFQGTTRNTALIHGTSRNTTLTQGASRSNALIHVASRNPVLAQPGTRNSAFAQGSTRNSVLTQSPKRNPALAVNSSPERSSLLAPVARHGSGRTHGVWSRPSKAAPAAAASPGEAAAAASLSSSSISTSVSSSSVTPMSMPSVSASQPIAPKPIIPQPQPIAPKPMAPKPMAPKPIAPKPIAPQPIVPQPIASQPVAPQPVVSQSLVPHASASADAGFVPVAQRGASSSRLPRYHPSSQGEVQPRLQPLQQPLQPVQLPQPHRQHPQPYQQPQPQQFRQQLVQDLGDGEQDLDQQQGKPLFSVLL